MIKTHFEIWFNEKVFIYYSKTRVLADLAGFAHKTLKILFLDLLGLFLESSPAFTFLYKIPPYQFLGFNFM